MHLIIRRLRRIATVSVAGLFWLNALAIYQTSILDFLVKRLTQHIIGNITLFDLSLVIYLCLITLTPSIHVSRLFADFLIIVGFPFVAAALIIRYVFKLLWWLTRSVHRIIRRLLPERYGAETIAFKNFLELESECSGSKELQDALAKDRRPIVDSDKTQTTKHRTSGKHIALQVTPSHCFAAAALVAFSDSPIMLTLGVVALELCALALCWTTFRILLRMKHAIEDLERGITNHAHDIASVIRQFTQLEEMDERTLLGLRSIALVDFIAAYILSRRYIHGWVRVLFAIMFITVLLMADIIFAAQYVGIAKVTGLKVPLWEIVMSTLLMPLSLEHLWLNFWMVLGVCLQLIFLTILGWGLFSQVFGQIFSSIQNLSEVVKQTVDLEQYGRPEVIIFYRNGAMPGDGLKSSTSTEA